MRKENIDIELIKATTLKNNAKIDKINTEQIRQEEKNKSAQERLRKALDNYCQTYNVAIKANSIDELLSFFEERAYVRGSELKKETDKQTQAIKLYEDGNIAGLNRLMGVDNKKAEFGYDNTDILGEVQESDKVDIEDFDNEEVEPEPKRVVKPTIAKKVKPATKPIEEVVEDEDIEIDESSFNTTGVNIADLLDDEDLAENDEEENTSATESTDEDDWGWF